MSSLISEFSLPKIEEKLGYNSHTRFDHPCIDMLRRPDAENFAEEIVSTLKKIAIIDKDPANRSKAAYLYGLIHLSGMGSVQKNVVEGMEWLHKSQDVSANYILGLHYIWGKGVGKDVQKGITYLQKAHEKHYSEASLALGTLYWQGIDTGQDQIKAKQYFSGNNCSSPTSQKLRDFLINLEIDYDITGRGWTCPQWIEKASPELQRNMFSRLGVISYNRIPFQTFFESPKEVYNLKPRFKEVIQTWCKILDISPSSNNKEEIKNVDTVALESLCNLGRAFYIGNKMNFRNLFDVESNKKQAVYYWTQAANNGHLRAQYYLGLAYCSGEGVSKDLEEGKKWLIKASEQKLLAATLMLNHLEGKEMLKVPSIPEGEVLNSPPIEGEVCIRSQKNFLSKIWTCIKKHSETILTATITSVAIAALVGGLVALTVFFPEVMIPLWIITGVIAGVAGGAIGLFLLAFAAGSGDKSAQNTLSTIGMFF